MREEDLLQVPQYDKDEILLSALKEEKIEEALNRLNASLCSAFTLSELICYTMERPEVVPLYRCYELALQKNKLTACRNLRQIPFFNIASHSFKVACLLRALAENKQGKILLDLLKKTNIPQNQEIMQRHAWYLVEQVCHWFIQARLSESDSEKIKKIKIENSAICLELLQALFTSVINFDALAYERLDIVKRLTQLCDERDFASCLPSAFLRSLVLSRLNVYGVPLSSFTTPTERASFLETPVKVVKEKGGFVRLQLAIDFLKLAGDFNCQELRRLVDFPACYGQEKFSDVVNHFKATMKGLGTLRECKRLYNALMKLNVPVAKAIVAGEPHTFTEKEARCYQNFIEKFKVPDTLVASLSNVYISRSFGERTAISEGDIKRLQKYSIFVAWQNRPIALGNIYQEEAAKRSKRASF